MSHPPSRQRAPRPWPRRAPRSSGRSRHCLRKLEENLERVRGEFRASESWWRALSLRMLNERQSSEGLDRLRSELRAMSHLGILDEHGDATSDELPLETQRGVVTYRAAHAPAWLDAALATTEYDPTRAPDAKR